MTKHPHDRQERLKIKKLKFEEKDTKHASHLRRRIKDQLREQEAKDAEVRAYRGEGFLESN